MSRSFPARLGTSLAFVPFALAQQPASPSSVTPQEPSARQQALDRAARSAAPSAAATATSAPRPGEFRLIDLSLVVDAAAGMSSVRDSDLASLQGGGHDPKKRGFTLQQAELGLAGVVDSYFRADARIVTFLDASAGETLVELEEAYLTSLSLPSNLQLKAGHFLTRFGRVNPQHPHAWDWMDQPIMNTRVFGGDGMRAPGAQLAWLAPTDSYAELFFSVQNANGETMRSFLANDELYAEAGVGGRLFAAEDVRSFGDLAYTLRGEASAFAAERSELVLGASFAFGPNATGDRGDTMLYGADFVWRWRPADAERGWPFVKIEGEFLGREFDAAEQVDDSVPGTPVTLPAATLGDRGGFVQGLWGFAPGWAVGVRAEYATGSGASYDLGTQTFARDADALRADRWRVAPLLAYHPSEFTRLRLQYNYDDSDALADPAHSVWIGFEVLIGAHPPHAY